MGIPFDITCEPIPIDNHKVLMQAYDASIHCYDYEENTLSETADTHPRHFRFQSSSLTFDQSRKLIYTYYLGCIRVINLRLQLFTWLCNFNGNSQTKIIFINDQLHIFGGHCSINHWIFDINTSKMTKGHLFLDLNTNQSEFRFNVKHIPSKNNILLYNADNKASIHEFCLMSLKWKKWSINIQRNISYESSMVITKDSKFMVLFGLDNKNNISVLNTESKEIQSSKIKMPLNKNYYSFIVSNNKNKDELLVSGFVKESLSSVFPQSLIVFTNNWFIFEEIHLIGKASNSSHLKINIDDIVASVA